MSRNYSSDEVKAGILKAFPTPETGTLFLSLLNDYSALCLHWGMYRELFNGDPERVSLLKWAAPIFFQRLRRLLSDDVMLRIARLTDPPKSFGHDNASFAQLIELLKFVDDQFASCCTKKLVCLTTLCEPVRVHRNRVLAHKDKLTLLASGENRLPAFANADMRNAMTSTAELLNFIGTGFGLTHHAFVESDFRVIHGGGIDALVASLQIGRDHEHCERK